MLPCFGLVLLVAGQGPVNQGLPRQVQLLSQIPLPMVVGVHIDSDVAVPVPAYLFPSLEDVHVVLRGG